MAQGWAGRRVLVTGAAGFLGRHVADRLVAEGATVVGMSRTDRAAEDGVRWIRGTLNDPAEATAHLSTVEPDVIVHLAAHVTAQPDVSHVRPTLASHLLSTVNVLEWATQTGGVRVVLPGSLEEPDESSGQQVPSSPYGAAKWAARGYTQMFAHLYDTDAVWLRLMMTYGPGQAPTKLLPHVAASLLTGQSPALSSGSRSADWVYVDDVVSAILAAAEPDRAGLAGRVIDVGSGALVSMRTLVEGLARLVGGPGVLRWGALPDRPAELSRAADLAAARDLLGWAPSTSLDEGLRRTVAWVAANRRADA